MNTWDVWAKTRSRFGGPSTPKVVRRISLDASYALPEQHGGFSSADLERIKTLFNVEIVQQRANTSLYVRSRRPTPSGRRQSSFQLWLRPPMTRIFDLTQDPSYRPLLDGSRFMWAIGDRTRTRSDGPEWLNTHGVIYQGESPIEAYIMPVALADIPEGRFEALRVAIDHYLETGRPLR